MAITRRGFLGRLFAGVAACYVPWPEVAEPIYIDVVDPRIEALNAVTLREIYAGGIADEFFTASPFLTYLRSDETTSCR